MKKATPDVPYELMERVLRNSYDSCQYCKRKFKEWTGLRRVFIRWLSKRPLYDPRNTAMLCHECSGFWEWAKQQIAFGLEE